MKKNNSMKKILLISVIALLILSGCAKKQTQELIFWHALGGPPGDALNEMVNDFNREHPDIRIKAISMGNYQALSQKIMASIQARNQPDLAQVYESWTANLINGNAIVCLDDFIENDPEFKENMSDIFPVFIACNTFDGKIWSFPFNKSVRVMYYNKDYFFRHGLDYNAPPTTWEEYLDLCKLFTEERRWGTAFNTDMWRFENLLLQAGGHIMNEDETIPLFNSPEGLEALNFFIRLLHEDRSAYLAPSFDAQSHFLAETIAFVEGSSVSYTFMKDAHIGFNMGLAPVPTFRNIISGTNIAIFNKNNPERAKAAWEFIRWFSLPKQTAKFAALTNYMPLRMSALEQPEIQKLIKDQPGLIGIYNQLNYAEFEPQIPQWFEFRRNFEEMVLENVFLGNIKPEVALQQAEQRLLRELRN
jgi:multiple sugar transport system substrate-binding protein